jgi:hypothetical protein
MPRLLILTLLGAAAVAAAHAQTMPAAPPAAPPATPTAPVASAAPTSFSFNGQTFIRAASKATTTGYMEEFLPAGQTLSNWTCMASIHHLTTAVPDPSAATRSVAQAVRQRNRDAQVLVMNNAATGTSLLDFVTWPLSAAGAPEFFEHDICKYRKAPEGGLVVFQYAERAYGPNGPLFLQNLKAQRQRVLPLMAAGDFNPK